MIRNLNIQMVLNGFIVQCGCQSIVYTSMEEMMSDLGAYLTDPKATEKKFVIEKGINRKHTLEDNAPIPCGGEVPSPVTATGIR